MEEDKCSLEKPARQMESQSMERLVGWGEHKSQTAGRKTALRWRNPLGRESARTEWGGGWLEIASRDQRRVVHCGNLPGRMHRTWVRRQQLLGVWWEGRRQTVLLGQNKKFKKLKASDKPLKSILYFLFCQRFRYHFKLKLNKITLLL